MSRASRLVLVTYCLVFAYCSIWVPWCVNGTTYSGRAYHHRVGYGWLWSGPHRSTILVYDPQRETAQEEVDTRSDDFTATPDFPLLGLRFVAVTMLAIAALTVVRLWAPRLNS